MVNDLHFYRPLFFTKYINEWLTENKATNADLSVIFEKQEQQTLCGSTCRIKVQTDWEETDMAIQRLIAL